MSGCLHCEIHELFGKPTTKPRSRSCGNCREGNRSPCRPNREAPPDEQSTLMADVLANLGSFLLEEKEAADPTNRRRTP